MQTRAIKPNRGAAVILATACMAMALLSISCGGGGSMAAGPVSAPGFAVSPTTVTFGNQPVGTTSTTQAATLTNAGTATLNISSIQVTGPNAGDFSATSGCGSSLAPSAQCTFSLTLTPSAAGTRTASVVFTDNADGSPQSVNLMGNGTSPGVDLSVDALTFGSQLRGTSSAAQPITLTNSGSAALNISSVALSGANASDFAQTNNCGSSVAAGGNCTISVTFTPAASGTRTAAVILTDNATGSPQSVSLSGTGTSAAAVANLSPTSLPFSSQSVGATSAAQVITLTNSGNAALSITSVALSGANASDFAQTNNCGSSVAAGTNCTISVTFTPVASGTRTAAVILTDNAIGSPQSVSLSGTGTSTAAVANLSPTSLSFSSQSVGATSTAQAITLTNSGNAALSITSLVLSGANASDFAQTNNCGSSVAAGANCTISVTFTPAASGTRSAAVILTDNATGSPQSVSLSGTGTSTAAVVSLSPASLAFGNQSVDTRSAAQTITLTNSGNTSLRVTSLAISGANASDFAQTNDCGSSVAAGANCTISVTFTPAARGTRSAAVTLTDNATGSPQSVSLSGTGTVAVVSVSPASLSFASQVVGTASAAQSITLNNTGNSAMSITSIALTGANASDFTQTNTCGNSLAASASCSVSVTFRPAASGSRTASLSITDNVSGSPQAVTLSGTGTSTAAVVSFSPASLAFGNQSVDTSSAAQPITLTNSGSAALNISSVALSGANASDFARTNNCGSSVAAGANCTISVTFTPAARGTRSAAVTLTDNATGSPQTVSLTGTGTAPAVSVAPASLSFASQVVGTAGAAQSITLNNTGNSAMSITSIALTGANATDFTQVDTCGTSVAAGGNCTITILFTPSATGTRVASLSIADNASGSPQAVSLSGTGTPPAPAGSTYYVDNCVAIGSDANNGASTATPWLTIHKVNTSTFNPGDSVLFESTCTWREQLTVPSSGAAGSPITFGAYGKGAQPIISGSNLLNSGWTNTSGNVWQVALTTQPNQVFFNGVRGTLETSTGNITAANEWYWASNVLYVYSTSNAATAFTSPGVEATIRSAIAGNGKSSIAITGIHTTKGTYGIWFQVGSANLAVTNVTSDWNYYDGVMVQDAGSNNFVATNLTSHDNLRDGVDVYSGPSNPTISGGTFYNNLSTYGCGVDFTTNIAGGSVTGVTSYNNFYGIKLFGSGVTNQYVGGNIAHDSTSFNIDLDTGPTGQVVEKNLVYNGGSHGIALEVTPSQNATVRYNLIYGNKAGGSTAGIELNSASGDYIYGNVIYGNDEGWEVLGGSTGNTFYGNTVYNSSNTAIDIESSSSGNVVKNNIIDTAGNYLMYIDAGSQASFVSNYNDWYGSGTFYGYGGSYSFANWKSNSGQDGNSINSNPNFVNASGGQFWLAGGSPAIAAGAALGSPYNVGIQPESSWPYNVSLVPNANSDLGAFPYTGSVIDSVIGSGTMAAASLSPSSLTFGNEAVDTTSSSQVVTLNNSGNAALSISSIAFTGANATDFTQVDTCGASVAAGGNCTIAILFTPSAIGTRTALLSISDNASGSPQPISLSGSGTQPGPAGTTYYVDNCVVIGSDANNGASTATPWLTIHKVNTSTFNPGDAILFESTCTWREQLTVASSGAAGNPITFGAYGKGAQPIISGADLLTSWITGASYYYAFVSVQPNIVFRDGAILTQVGTKGSLATGDWWWDSTNSYVWLYDNPSGHTIEAGTRSEAIITGAVSNLSITGLHATKANAYGIVLNGGNVTVNGVISDYNDLNGLFSWTGSSSISNGVTIENSTFAYNGGSGIAFGYVNNWLIQGNNVHNNCWDPLQTYIRGIDGGNPYTTNVIVQNNSVYENDSTGIHCDTCGSGIVFRYNNVWGNAGYGLSVESDNNVLIYYNIAYNNWNAGIAVVADANSSMTGMQIYNNTVYGNGNEGILVGGPSSGSAPAGCTDNTIENNIVVATVGGPNLAAYNGCENPGTNGSGNVYTYNDFGAQASNFIQWGAGVYDSTYTAWETATGNCGTPGCSHSVQADPAFVNPSASQFWLASNSPAIDAGTNLGSPYNIGLLPANSWPNPVVTGDQNSYGTGWEVGAYIFTEF